MGLFDKIKKAIDDSGVIDAAKKAIDDSGVIDAAKKAIDKTGMVDTVKTATTIFSAEAAQAELENTKVAEPVKVAEDKPKAPPKPACEHGKCVICQAGTVCDEKLYFTCGEDVSCPKKQKNECGELWDEEIFPIIKAYATYNNSSGWDNRQDNLRKTANKIVKTYIPQLNSYDFVTEIGDSIYIKGVEKSNQFLVYLVNLKRKNIEITPEKKKRFQETILILKNYIYEYGRVLDASGEWLYNPSLYNSKCPAALIETFLDFSNPKWTKTHLYDDSVVDINQLFNEDGTIKELGEQGVLSDDTFYGVVEKWYTNNKNEETFAKERRMAICRGCRRVSNCNMIGMHDDCPAYYPL